MLRHNQRVNRGKMASADQIRMRVLRIYPIMTVPRILMIPLLSVKLTLLNLGVLTPWPVQIKVHGLYAPEWVRTSDPVIRSPARYRWTTAPASVCYIQWGPLGSYGGKLEDIMTGGL